MTRVQKRGPGGRARQGRGISIALLAAMAAIAACTDGSGVSITTTPSARPGSPSPGATGPAGTGNSSGVGGGIGGGGNATPTTGASGGGGGTTTPSAAPTGGTGTGGGVKAVAISPTAATLNVPAEDGVTTASYASSQIFSATVFLDPTGQNGQVTWSITPGAAVSTSSAGAGGLGYSVAVLSGAGTGSLVLTATSIKDPTRFATASIVVTRNSQVNLDIK